MLQSGCSYKNEGKKVCVAWFAEQEKYTELFEINKRMTVWLMGKTAQLKEF